MKTEVEFGTKWKTRERQMKNNGVTAVSVGALDSSCTAELNKSGWRKEGSAGKMPLPYQAAHPQMKPIITGSTINNKNNF